MTIPKDYEMIRASAANEAAEALKVFEAAKRLSAKQDEWDFRSTVAEIKKSHPYVFQVQENYAAMREIIDPAVAFAESINLDDIPMVINGKRHVREQLVREIALVRGRAGQLATISLWLNHWRALDYEDDAREMLRTEWQRQYYTQGFRQILLPWSHPKTIEDTERVMAAHTSRIVELLQALAGEMASPDFPQGNDPIVATTFIKFAAANPDAAPNVHFDEPTEPTAADTVAALQRRSDLDSEPVPGEESE
jgi:hypothetical protein